MGALIGSGLTGAEAAHQPPPEREPLRRPRLLDLFSCSGGAARGYQLAGWHVTGVDKDPQPRYAGDDFIQADVTALTPEFVASFDGVHASPPCQFGTKLRHAPNTLKTHINLIPPTRALLEAAGVPWIIENVDSTDVRPHMPGFIRLCGSQFGLGADGFQLERHRLFIASFPIFPPGPCRHADAPVIGVYGAHVRCRSKKYGGRGTRDFIGKDKPSLAKAAMGMDWGTMHEMSEAIPPAYTHWLGLQLRGAMALPGRGK